MSLRLNRYLAQMGVCSRRKADALIAEGKVKVNGTVAGLGTQVEEQDVVEVDGRVIDAYLPEPMYLAFHKPIGIMTSVDPNAKDTVRSYLQLPNHMFPVGRLDVASSGLLLLTNDGTLSERITHPRYNHEKEYVVNVNKPVRREDLRTMSEGMMILGSRTKPAVVEKTGVSQFSITLTEGRNRQIRRMCEALGYTVQALQRVRVMNILLGDLPSGHVRQLSKKELLALKRELGLK